MPGGPSFFLIRRFSFPAFHSGFTLRKRLALSVFLLIGELLCLTVVVDLAPLAGAPGVAGLAGRYGSLGLRLMVLSVAFTTIFAAFSRPGLVARPEAPFERRQSRTAICIHLLLFCAFAACSMLVCRVPGGAERDFLIFGSTVAGAASMISAALAFVELSFWKALRNAVPRAPWWGCTSAIATVVAAREGNWISHPWTGLTLEACYRVLQLLPVHVAYDPVNSSLATPRFAVEVSPQCSGYEGMVLILAFSAVWLAVFRREFRFPQALLMMPLGASLSWALNVCRIVILLLIGHMGAPQVAIGGFHSEAGWISFIGLAVLLAVVFQRSAWTAVRQREHQPSESALVTETAAYLIPFLAILAAGMVAQAASSGFEWLYVLRVAAAAVDLSGEASRARLACRSGGRRHWDRRVPAMDRVGHFRRRFANRNAGEPLAYFGACPLRLDRLPHVGRHGDRSHSGRACVPRLSSPAIRLAGFCVGPFSARAGDRRGRVLADLWTAPRKVLGTRRGCRCPVCGGGSAAGADR